MRTIKNHAILFVIGLTISTGAFFPLRQHSCGGRTTANAGLPTLSVPIRGICCPGKEDLFPKARVSLYKEV